MITRMRMHISISDPLYLMLPAFVLMLLNAWIVVKAWRSGAS